MKKTSFFLLLTYLVFTQCTQQEEDDSSVKVTNAVDTGTNNALIFPNIVRWGYTEGTSTYDCTGSMVGEKTMLTAAHCFGRKTTVSFSMPITIFVSGKGQISDTGTVFLHPKYIETTKDRAEDVFYSTDGSHDLAVILFSSSQFQGFTPVKFRMTELQDNEEVALIGYGNTDTEKNTGSGGTQRLGSNTFEQDSLSFWFQANTLENGIIRFSGVSKSDGTDVGKNSSVGQGDSGGPLMDKDAKIIGVASNRSVYENENRTDSVYSYLLHKDNQSFLVDTAKQGAKIPIICCICTEEYYMSIDDEYMLKSSEELKIPTVGETVEDAFCSDNEVTEIPPDQQFVKSSYTLILNCQKVEAQSCLQ